MAAGQLSTQATEVEVVTLRYVVATRLAGDWLPRAVLRNAEQAEAEAFRWRRIYGRNATQVLEIWVSDANDAETVPRGTNTLPAPILDSNGDRSRHVIVGSPRDQRGTRRRRLSDRRNWLRLQLTQRLLELMTLYIIGEMALKVLTTARGIVL